MHHRAACVTQTRGAVLHRLEKDYYAKLDGGAAARALHTVVHAGPGASVIELT